MVVVGEGIVRVRGVFFPQNNSYFYTSHWYWEKKFPTWNDFFFKWQFFSQSYCSSAADTFYRSSLVNYKHIFLSNWIDGIIFASNLFISQNFSLKKCKVPKKMIKNLSSWQKKTVVKFLSQIRIFINIPCRKL